MAATKLADYLLENPLYGFSQGVLKQGTSTAPVQSPWEGLARALQGGVGGFFQGQAIREAKGEQRSDQEALAQAMELYANDPAGARKILATRPNLSDTASALLMNDVGYQRQIDLLKAKDQLEQQAQGRDMQMFFPGAQGGTGTQVAGGTARTGQLESGGNYSAVNPTSGAGGKYQFMPETWATVAQSRPDLNLPSSWRQATPQQQEAAKTALDQINGRDLQTAGIPVNDGTLYLAHRFGAKGAQTFMSAPDNAPLAAIFQPIWIQQNPDLQNKTVGQFKQFVAQNFGGGGPQPTMGTPPAAMVAQGANAAPMPSVSPQQVGAGPGTPAQMPDGRAVIAQGSTPQGAPGAPQQGQQPQGQTALNVPNGETIQFQGLDLPRAAVASAMMIRDAKERQGKLTDIVRDAVKKASGPDAGTAAGDVHVLDQALKDGSFASDPRYVAAFNRASEPKMSQQGQLQYPDMSAYPRPILPQGQPTNSGQPRFEDTPASRFQMSGKLADDFNQLKQVKDYREVVPIYQSMQDAATRNNRVADLNLVYGLAKIMDPTSVVREGEQIMVRNAQGLPDWVKGMISAVNGGSQFPPEQRARILQEAESRVGAYKQQHDSIAQQFTERAQRYGLDPRDVLTTPGGGQQQQAPAQGGERPVYDTTGKRIK